MSKSLFFSFLVVLFFVTLNPVFAASPKEADPDIIPREDAEAAGFVCGARFNSTLATKDNVRAGDSFCVPNLMPGKTIGQTKEFIEKNGNSRDRESARETMENLEAFLRDVPADSFLKVVCSDDEIGTVGCQNGLSAKANACAAGTAVRRCQNAMGIVFRANPGLVARTTQVFATIKATRQVIFLVSTPARASGNERCTKAEIDAAAKVKLAGDHTEAFKARIVVLVEGQKLPAGVVERVVTLTIPGHEKVGSGIIVRYPEQVKSCRLGLVSAGSLPPDPPAGVPEELRATPTPAPERETTCTDGVDNDGDGKIDCADSDCYNHAAVCQKQPEICDDGIDNDRDDFVDKDDSDCLPKAPKPSGPSIFDDLNLQFYFMGLQERPPVEEFRNMENPGLKWKDYTNFQFGLGIPFKIGADVVLTTSILAGMRTTQYTAAETTGPLLGDRHAWVIGGEISLLKKVGKDLFAGVEPGFYYGQNGADPYLNGKIQLQITPRVGVALILGARVVKNHLTDELVFLPRIGAQISFTWESVFW